MVSPIRSPQTMEHTAPVSGCQCQALDSSVSALTNAHWMPPTRPLVDGLITCAIYKPRQDVQPRVTTS